MLQAKWAGAFGPVLMRIAWLVFESHHLLVMFFWGQCNSFVRNSCTTIRFFVGYFTGKSQDAPTCGRGGMANGGLGAAGPKGFFLGRSPGLWPGFFTCILAHNLANGKQSPSREKAKMLPTASWREEWPAGVWGQQPSRGFFLGRTPQQAAGFFTDVSTHRLKLVSQQLLYHRRTRLTPRGAHHLAHKKLNHRLFATEVLLHRVRVLGQHLSHDLCQGRFVGDLCQTPFLNDFLRRMDVLMVLFSTNTNNSAKPCGVMHTASISVLVSFIQRKRSPMIQLATVLAWG
jgi:hypothetical protein